MEFAHPEYLVETDWLEAHLDEVCVLDVTAMLTAKLENRAERECFDVGHIPGSHFFDVASGKGVLSDPGGGLPLDVAGRDAVCGNHGSFWHQQHNPGHPCSTHAPGGN